MPNWLPILIVGEKMSNNILRGTALLSGAALLSRILGMIYVIPFNAIVGPDGGTLYGYAYIPYSILISVSTVGVPLAVSKFVSKYNSLGDYKTSLHMFRLGLIMMLTTGVIAFLALFFSAEWLAQIIGVNDEYGTATEDIKMVLQMISFALLIVPVMSIFRGFFQGNQSMGPTAVSQVIEQIVRIIFVLVSGYLVVFVFKGTIPTAVGFATFAAFIGAIASLIVLLLYWRNRRKHIYENIRLQTTTHNMTNREMFFELFQYAGPFVLVGLAIPLYQLVDVLTFKKVMIAIGQGEISNVAFSVINVYGHKLVNIPVTIATGLSLAIIPEVTKAFTQNNYQLLSKQINQAIQIILVLVIPAVVGLSALANLAYGSLFGMENIEITGSLLAWYAPAAVFLALYTVSAAILQGLNEQNYAVLSLFIGLIIKISLNSYFIQLFGAKGSIFATGLAFAVAVLCNLLRIRTAIGFSFKQIFRRSILILLLSSVMLLVLMIVKWLFGLFIPYETSRAAATLMLVIGVGIGGAVYLYLANKTTLIYHVFGPIKFLDRFKRRKGNAVR